MFEEVPSTPFISPVQDMNTEKKGLSGIGPNEAQGFKRHIYWLDLLQIGALRCKTGKKLEKPADAMHSGRVLRRSQSTKHQAAWQPRWRRRLGGVATVLATGGGAGNRARNLAAVLAARRKIWQASKTHRR